MVKDIAILLSTNIEAVALDIKTNPYGGVSGIYNIKEHFHLLHHREIEDNANTSNRPLSSLTQIQTPYKTSLRSIKSASSYKTDSSGYVYNIYKSPVPVAMQSMNRVNHQFIEGPKPLNTVGNIKSEKMEYTMSSESSQANTTCKNSGQRSTVLRSHLRTRQYNPNSSDESYVVPLKKQMSGKLDICSFCFKLICYNLYSICIPED